MARATAVVAFSPLVAGRPCTLLPSAFEGFLRDRLARLLDLKAFVR
jgi:hypothetical protein